MSRNRAIAMVIMSSALFGASTPLARGLVGAIDPLWLAGLLYAGSGLGLCVILALRHGRIVGGEAGVARIAPGDLCWLAATIFAGGVVAPLLFTFGLRDTNGAAASLLLNLETVLTVLIAWFVFGEHRNARVVIGMALIAAACALLAWDRGGDSRLGWGALLIAAACLCWALDNNLTRRISGNDAMLVAASKGLVGGGVNVGLAAMLAGAPPAPTVALAAGVVGFLGYGVSLTLFVVALREIGVARASAYYGSAPFFGAAIALLVLGERPDSSFWIAAPLMAVGVWLHLTERHGHVHSHERMSHSHPHVHDEHHRHDHGNAWDGKEPHAHPHVHEPVVHAHRHDPDLHHRHEH